MDYEVIYYSWSSRKNTEQIADEIAGALGVTAKKAASDLKIERSKVLFIGSGVYFGHIGRELKKFIENLPQIEGQKAAIFGTHGGGPKNAYKELTDLLEEKGITVINQYTCLGAWAVFKLGHPNEQEIQRARDFARETAGKAQDMGGIERGELKTSEKIERIAK